MRDRAVEQGFTERCGAGGSQLTEAQFYSDEHFVAAVAPALPREKLFAALQQLLLITLPRCIPHTITPSLHTITPRLTAYPPRLMHIPSMLTLTLAQPIYLTD